MSDCIYHVLHVCIALRCIRLFTLHLLLLQFLPTERNGLNGMCVALEQQPSKHDNVSDQEGAGAKGRRWERRPPILDHHPQYDPGISAKLTEDSDQAGEHTRRPNYSTLRRRLIRKGFDGNTKNGIDNVDSWL